MDEHEGRERVSVSTGDATNNSASSTIPSTGASKERHDLATEHQEQRGRAAGELEGQNGQGISDKKYTVCNVADRRGIYMQTRVSRLMFQTLHLTLSIPSHQYSCILKCSSVLCVVMVVCFRVCLALGASDRVWPSGGGRCDSPLHTACMKSQRLPASELYIFYIVLTSILSSSGLYLLC